LNSLPHKHWTNKTHVMSDTDLLSTSATQWRFEFSTS
jgi:hypothetical protein